jgi:hypothetical protein
MHLNCIYRLKQAYNLHFACYTFVSSKGFCYFWWRSLLKCIYVYYTNSKSLLSYFINGVGNFPAMKRYFYALRISLFGFFLSRFIKAHRFCGSRNTTEISMWVCSPSILRFLWKYFWHIKIKLKFWVAHLSI